MKLRKYLFLFVLLLFPLMSKAVGASDMYQWTVALHNYISPETGKAPQAYLWVPEGCKKVRAVMFAMMNMTEEQLFKMPSFQARLKEMDVALLWIAPAFSHDWDPNSGCQAIFDEMITDIAYQSGHTEIATAPLIPFGHSAHATVTWNFAAWNNARTLCIISFHGDAPRTNLCGYGGPNIEWGRTRNIDGIPGLMIEGEFEWWEGRVTPALAFQIIYPESCISFLCDAGRGHFDCSEETAEYIAKFIEKAFQQRMAEDGTLRKVNRKAGWLACRYNADLPMNDGDGTGTETFSIDQRPKAAPYAEYQGDRHDAFWYPDEEMAQLTEARYADTHGKQQQFVGFEYEGKPVAYDTNLQGGMRITFKSGKDGLLHLKAIYTDETHTGKAKKHGKATPRIEVVSGPLEKVSDTTFRIYPYEAGLDNPRRSFNAWLVAVAESDETYKGAVQPIQVLLPQK